MYTVVGQIILSTPWFLGKVYCDNFSTLAHYWYLSWCVSDKHGGGFEVEWSQVFTTSETALRINVISFVLHVASSSALLLATCRSEWTSVYCQDLTPPPLRYSTSTSWSLFISSTPYSYRCLEIINFRLKSLYPWTKNCFNVRSRGWRVHLIVIICLHFVKYMYLIVILLHIYYTVVMKLLLLPYFY